MRVEPITCLRPEPSRVAEFASLPYDVFTDAEARSYVEAHPTSFLAIDRPETAFEPDHDPYAPEVYAHAKDLLRERQLDGTLVRDEKPCFYVYDLIDGDHRQRGIMGAVSVDDYDDGTIRKHELTLPSKELDRVRHITGLRAQTGPVFLAYHDSLAIDVILDAATQADPLYDFVASDGVRQRVWRLARTSAVEAISLTFTTVAHAYIADGHHRAAAAARICRDRRAEGRENDPAESFLAVLFPISHLRILPYDRVVTNTCGHTEQSLVAALGEAGFDCSAPLDAAFVPTRKGEFGLFAFGAWRSVSWTGDADALDVDVLQSRVFAPLLGIEDPRTDPRLQFVGNPSPADLEQLAGDTGMAFSLFPTSMDELVAIADEGGIMPPKSTWFEPKLQSGLALRRIW